MKKKIECLLAILLYQSIAFTSLAVTPDERLKDPQLEAQARSISAELRCLVCQNQSIDDSDAGLAKDLRVLVRERLLAGDTPNEVQNHVVGLYGEYVLLKPKFGFHTTLLWIAPLALLIGAVMLASTLFRRKIEPSSEQSNTLIEPLSKIEENALDELKNLKT